MTRYGMLIDLNKCFGCNTCTIACKVENSTPPGMFWCTVDCDEKGEYPAISREFLPRSCAHCQNPPCVEGCPTGASYKADDGIVMIDHDKCAGCKYCIVVCPYGARSFLEEVAGYYGEELTPCEQIGYRQRRGRVVEKCTFCAHRVREGLQPACVEDCPVGARYFGDLDDPSSTVSRLLMSKRAFSLLPELGTLPNMFYFR